MSRSSLTHCAQLTLVLCLWGYLCGLHSDNDGLWYQGDSPRHAANGLFWKSYLLNFTPHAREYALSYYARYPVINPVAYPPVFYLAEAVAYGIFGPSPYVAKGVVLVFALIAAVYTNAWLRRWVGPQAGWMAGLFVMLPSVIAWSHAIMLNIPALALALGALYHAKIWIEPSESKKGPKHLLLAISFGLLAGLTYYPNIVIVFVVLAWIIAAGAWRRWLRPLVVLPILASTLLLLPVLAVIREWTPTHLTYWILPDAQRLLEVSRWTYYAGHLPTMFGTLVLALAAMGVVFGLIDRQRRHETAFEVIGFLTIYAFFSYLVAKEPRYVLPLAIPLISLAAQGVCCLSHVLALVTKRQRAASAISFISGMGLLLAQTSKAEVVDVPSVRGVRQAAEFLKQVAPQEPVLYDGFFNGIFTYYLQAGDPCHQRRVVRGDKLFYAFASLNWRRTDFVRSPQDVVDVLRARGGCRWLAIESSINAERIEPQRHLRQAVQGSDFELIRSFPVEGNGFTKIAVYRFKLPVEQHDMADIPFPLIGPDARHQTKPIPTKRSGSPPLSFGPSSGGGIPRTTRSSLPGESREDIRRDRAGNVEATARRMATILSRNRGRLFQLNRLTVDRTGSSTPLRNRRFTTRFA